MSPVVCADDPHARFLTRRRWLCIAGAGAAGLGMAWRVSRAGAAAAGDALDVTGAAVPALAPFDRLMSAFLREQGVPGAALAVGRAGRLVYARGFGVADRAQGDPVRPDALFRIASLSKPLTAVAVLRLVEQGRLALGDCAAARLGMETPGDPRWRDITVLHLLQHTGGWDRERSGDPMFRSVEVARAVGVAPPAMPDAILRYMAGQPLDFAPGERYAYSNFGYCLLGRIVERVSGEPYGDHVRRAVLAPLGIETMRLGRTLRADRAPNEVAYHDDDRTAPAVVGDVGRPVPRPYGAWCLEAMDAHGGWLGSAPDLVRFAAAFDVPERCPILKAETIAAMFARPEGVAGREADGSPRAAYYGCGWSVRPAGTAGGMNTWHMGGLDGTSTLLVRRHDGIDWAVLFNARRGRGDRDVAATIDGPLHAAANAVEEWPTGTPPNTRGV